jgi:alpha-methylacyl-CoA racemase
MIVRWFIIVFNGYYCRGKRSLAVDIKLPEGVTLVCQLVKQADVIIEPFRPGVMERLGLGPDVLLADNPRLIFARLSGFGQQGKQCTTATINYMLFISHY